MARKSLSLIPLSLVMLGIAAGEARAYCLLNVGGSNPYVSWSTMPVSYRVSSNLSDPALLGAIDAAFNTWGSVTCSTLALSKGAQLTPCFQSPCPANTVAFTQSTGTINVFWYDDPTGYPTSNQYVSYTYLIHDGQGHILSAAIAINAFGYKWTASGGSPSQSILDLQNEMTAFVGQAIGLTSSNVPGASLYPGIYYGDTSKRTLAQDDIDGLVYLYKEASCTTPPAPGVDGCSALPPPDAGVPDGPPVTPDAGPPDSGTADVSIADVSMADVGVVDVGATEAAPHDAAPADQATGDGSAGSDAVTPGDALVHDTAPSDQSTPDGPAQDGGPHPGDVSALDSGGDGWPPVAPPAQGCNCRVGDDSSDASWWLLAALLILLLRRQRRERRQRRGARVVAREGGRGAG